MASKKAGGSSRNGRDSNAKRRGVKLFGGQKVNAGGIIVRQVGTKLKVGKNVCLGKDFTIYALIDGTVNFSERRGQKLVNVLPISAT